MSQRNVLLNCFSGLRMGLAAVVAAQLALGGAFASSAQAEEREAERTRTPIKHVIVLIGENRTFDHVFATYKPKKGEFVNNLLSKGIVKEDGTPGPNFARAKQFQAVAPFKTQFFISLKNSEKAPYDILPQPTLNFAPTSTIFPPGTPAPFLAAIEPSLEIGDVNLLTTGAATGFPQNVCPAGPGHAHRRLQHASRWPVSTQRNQPPL